MTNSMEAICLCCCRTLREHGAKRQCPETTYFVENQAAIIENMRDREKEKHIETLRYLGTQYLPGGPRDIKGALRIAILALQSPPAKVEGDTK